jgi:hypothetical protein
MYAETKFMIPGKNKELSIPFKLILNHIILTANFDNKQEIKLVVDTGMPVKGIILFESEKVRNLGLNYVSQSYVGGAGGAPVSANITHGVEITIQNLRLENQNVLVMPINQNIVTSLNADGIIGYELFSQYLVQIDFENELINLIDPSLLTSSNGGYAIPLQLKQNYPFINCSISIGNHNHFSVNLVVDLGAGHAVSLDVQSSNSIYLPDDTLDIRVGTGAVGDVQGYIGRIRELKLGKFSFASVISTFTLGPLAKGFVQCNGNLGIDLLRRFNITFDYPNSKMYLSPNHHSNDPFEFNKAGFQFQKTSDGFFNIDHVINNSPASEVGLRKNDLIVEINDQPANCFGSDFLNKLLLREGMDMAFKIQREEKLQLLSLKLRGLI